MRKFSNVETEKLIIRYLLNIYRLIFEKICKYRDLCLQEIYILIVNMGLSYKNN